MQLNRLLPLSVALTVLLVAGCSKPEDAQPSASGKSDTSAQSAQPSGAGKGEISVQAVAAEAKGFTVGAIMSAHTVYVFFDPQCPHCGHLWNAAMPLHKKAKFVWIPVAWINPSSLSQGAALLTAANPLELMTEHETSLLGGRGGISAPSGIAPEIDQAIKANTKLLNRMGAESVPFIVVKNANTGQTISKDGALSTAALAEMIGVDPS